MKDSEPASRKLTKAAAEPKNVTSAPSRLRSQARKKRRPWVRSGSWLAGHWSPVTATVMAALLVGIVLGNWSPLWAVGVVSVACVFVALGWPSLTGIHMGMFAQAMTAIVGVVAALVTALTHNFANVAPVVGLGMGCAVAITLFLGPTPFDHSRRNASGVALSVAGASAQIDGSLDGQKSRKSLASKSGREGAKSAKSIGGLSSPAGTSSTPALAASRLRRGGASHTSRAGGRSATRQNAGPFSMAANTMCAMVVASTAACWVALIDSPAWAPLSIPAGVIVAAVVLGDQWGKSFKANSWGALFVAVIVGVALTVLASVSGRGSQLPAVFGFTRTHLGPDLAAGLLGLVTGVVVACAVIAVDGLLGDHVRHSTRLGAAARGCVKFLVAAVPVYAMIRVGAL